MGALHQLLNAIIVICLIYVIAVLLKRRTVLKEENSLTLARLVTDVCLPAMVFTGLAGLRVTVKELEPSALMLGLEISCVLLAWGVTSFCVSIFKSRVPLCYVRLSDLPPSWATP